MSTTHWKTYEDFRAFHATAAATVAPLTFTGRVEAHVAKGENSRDALKAAQTEDPEGAAAYQHDGAVHLNQLWPEPVLPTAAQMTSARAQTIAASTSTDVTATRARQFVAEYQRHVALGFAPNAAIEAVSRGLVQHARDFVALVNRPATVDASVELSRAVESYAQEHQLDFRAAAQAITTARLDLMQRYRGAFGVGGQ